MGPGHQWVAEALVGFVHKLEMPGASSYLSPLLHESDEHRQWHAFFHPGPAKRVKTQEMAIDPKGLTADGTTKMKEGRPIRVKH